VRLLTHSEIGIRTRHKVKGASPNRGPCRTQKPRTRVRTSPAPALVELKGRLRPSLVWRPFCFAPASSLRASIAPRPPKRHVLWQPASSARPLKRIASCKRIKANGSPIAPIRYEIRPPPTYFKNSELRPKLLWLRQQRTGKESSIPIASEMDQRRMRQKISLKTGHNNSSGFVYSADLMFLVANARTTLELTII
jgi:hypothetical protein